MAITEIHPITATVHKAIAYICNPEKTDDKLLVSSYGCAPETAHFDFAFTRQNAAVQSPNLAYHLIQAFAPGEVTPEQAHRIGQELADSLLKGKHSYVVTTHIDKGHVHNHIIFSAVDNEKYQHYNDCKRTYYQIRRLNDNLCQEHGLSVIEEPSGVRGMSWWEWNMTQDGGGQKAQLKKDINKCIQITDSFDGFLEFMKAKGYQVKMGKYISFGLPGSDRFIRGKVNTLGKNYTKEKIQERIGNKKPVTMQVTIRQLQYLLEMSETVLQSCDNARLRQWATKENLKRMAETYNQMVEMGIHGLDELDGKMEKTKNQKLELKSSLKQLEKEQKELTELGKYLKQYKDTKATYQQYRKAYFRDRFFREHEGEIIIHNATKDYFRKKGIDPKQMKEELIYKQSKRILQNKTDLKNQIDKVNKQTKGLELMSHNLKEYLYLDTLVKDSKERVR